MKFNIVPKRNRYRVSVLTSYAVRGSGYIYHIFRLFFYQLALKFSGERYTHRAQNITGLLEKHRRLNLS